MGLLISFSCFAVNEMNNLQNRSAFRRGSHICGAWLAFLIEYQNSVLFADKSRFILSTCDRCEMVWRRGGAIFVTVQDDQFGGWSGMVRSYTGAVGYGLIVMDDNGLSYAVCRPFLVDEEIDTND